jgi:alkanesulfonate monooxygenase SsuD/methylene tetrahydromethanopterin reductase-like flavin-dependent oxidoreductase (luciferase family)
MVGGSGEKLLLRVAAKHADRYNHPFGTPDELKRKVDVLKEHCKSIGRDYKEIEKSVLIRVIVSDSDKEVTQIIRTIKNRDETVEQYLDRTNGKIAVGTPEQIIADLNKYMEYGITHFILHFMALDSSKMLKLFASKVIKRI